MKRYLMLTLVLAMSSSAFANPIQTPFVFPTARVLPKGVRNLSYKGAIINANRKFDENGQNVSIAEPFFRPLSFSEIMKGETDPAKRGLIEDTMNALGANPDDSFGDTTGQVNVKVNAHVPVLAWGLTRKITVAAVVPVVKSSLNVDSGVIQRNQALHQQMIADIKSKGASAKVVEFIDKMNQPVPEKLKEYGYQPLQNENKTELGDIRLLTKYQLTDNGINRITLTGGLTIPTGHDQDVNKVVDVISGDGQTDIAIGADYDYMLSDTITLSMGTLYTFQLSDQNAERIPERVDSKLSKDIDPNTERNLGDIWMLAAAGTFSYKGFVAGAGYNFQIRQRDEYEGALYSRERYNWLGEETFQRMHAAMAKVGYNTIHLFRQKKFPVPLAFTLSHTQVLGGVNVVNDGLTALDMSIFF